MWVFFTLRRKNFRDIRRVEAQWQEVERQLDASSSCTTAKFKRNLTNAAGIAGNWTIARRINGKRCRNLVALARFIVSRRTSASDCYLFSKHTSITIANRTKERAHSHTKCDERDDGQTKHIGGCIFRRRTLDNPVSIRCNWSFNKGELDHCLLLCYHCALEAVSKP